MGAGKERTADRGVFPGDINTSDVLTKFLSSVKLRNFLDGNVLRIATAEREKEIRI